MMPLESTGRSIEEIEAEVARAASENRVPFDQEIVVPVPRPNGKGEEPGFTVADLTGDLLSRSVPYEVPGTGKALHVFGLGESDYQLLLDWTADIDGGEGEKDPRRKQMKAAVAYREMKVCQVILCCRQGPDKRNKRCFERGDTPAVKKLLPYGCVQQICRLSDSLSGEDEALGPGVLRFFGSIQSAISTSVGALNTSTNCPPGLTDTLTQLASLVSHARRLGKLDSGTLSNLEEMQWPQ